MQTPPQPPGTHIFVCLNKRPDGSPLPCCANRGGESVLAAFQAAYARRGYPRGVKISGSTCLTTCQHGPTVVVYPEGIWYGPVTVDDVGDILDAHAGGDVTSAEHLRVPPETRVW